MPKKESLLPLFALGCAGLIILAFIFVVLLFQSFEKAWSNQLATLIATDDSIVAFGDGAHAVPITSGSTLNIGETGTVFEIEITVDDAGLKEAAKNTSGEWEYWFVKFTGESISNEILFGINPGVNSQLQYLDDNVYTWHLDEFEERQCDDENLTDGFIFGESFHCRYVYLVPTDERDLYWVFKRTDTGDDGEFEERYVVFQIR